MPRRAVTTESQQEIRYDKGEKQDEDLCFVCMSHGELTTCSGLYSHPWPGDHWDRLQHAMLFGFPYWDETTNE